MAITYDAPSNKITISGYTEGSPCTFTDLYNADVAGAWGVVHKQGALQFKLDCDLEINTWLADTNKQITVEKASGRFFMNANGVFKLGTKVSDYVGEDGCTLYFTSPHILALYFGSGRLLWYDSMIRHGSIYLGATADLVHEMIGCILKDANLLRIKGANSIIYHLTYHGGTAYSLNPLGTLKILEDVLVQNRQFGFYFYPDQGNAEITDLRTLNVTTGIVVVGAAGDLVRHANMIDCTLENWNISWSGLAYNSKIYRQYTFNLKVMDKDGDSINGASVKIWDKNDTLLVDTTTTAGVITEQTISYGYYDQNHGSVIQSYSPHEIQITKSGYKSYTKKFKLDEKVNWKIALKKRERDGVLTY